MTFTIADVYKASMPRGQWFRSALHKLENGSTSPLTVSPTTTPAEWALLIDSIRVYDNSAAMSGTGTGQLKVQYPGYPGVSLNTYEFTDDHLAYFPDDVSKGTASDLAKIFFFKPPILLKASNAEKSITIGLGDNRDISSGDISFLVTGWQIKESDYD